MKKNYHFVQANRAILTQYGLMIPSLDIEYGYTKTRTDVTDKDLVFMLEEYSKYSKKSIPGSISQKCTLRSKTYQTDIREYSKEIAQNFAHHDIESNSLGILFTQDQIETLFGPLLDKGYNQIKSTKHT